MKRFLLAALAPLFVFTAAAKPEIVRMTVDYQSCLVTVGAHPPVFGWQLSAGDKLTQKSYRFVVASSEKKLRKGDYDLWDSGTVKSDVSVTREGDRLHWTFTIPSNTTAEVLVPGSSKVKNYSSGTYTVEVKW